MRNLLLATLLLLSSLAIAQEKIQWMSIAEAEEAMQKEPRKVVIDVYTNWCGWCKKMDQTTFRDSVIARYINNNYYAVKLNAEQKDTIRFKGQKFTYVNQGRSGYHQLAAILLQGKMSYPSIVYLDEDLNMIQAVPGYMNAAQFEQVVKFIGDNHYQKTPFEDFKKNFRSELTGG